MCKSFNTLIFSYIFLITLSFSKSWSYGVLLFELATYGMSPYPGVELVSVYSMLESGYRMECPNGCPSKIYALMIDCWQWEPALRPSFTEIRERLENMFNNTNLNEEVERELEAENNNECFVDLELQQQLQQNEMTNSSFKVFKSSLNGSTAPYKNKQSGSTPNVHASLKENSNSSQDQLAWNSMNVSLNNSPSSGLISSGVPMKRNVNATNKSSKSGYMQQHQLVSKLKQAPVPPKRTSSFRDPSFTPDLESIRNSIANSVNHKSNNRINQNLSKTNAPAASNNKQLQPEDEDILEGAREAMNGLEKVFGSLSSSVQSSTDNLMGSNLNELNNKNNIEELKNVISKQKLQKPSKKGLKLSKSSHKNLLSSSKNNEIQNEDKIEKPNVFSKLTDENTSRSKVQVASLEPDNLKKTINRYGTLPKKGSNLSDFKGQENSDLNNDYPNLQANDSLLTSPDFIPVDYNRQIKQINANNHLATVSRKSKKLTKSIDDSGFNLNQQSFQLSPEQRLINSGINKPNAFNLTRQKSDFTHCRTNYDNSFDSLNDLELSESKKSFINSSNLFAKPSKSSSKKTKNQLSIDGSYLPSTSSSASSSNSNTINRDFSLGGYKENKENDDNSSISSFRPSSLNNNASVGNQLSSPPFGGMRRNLKKSTQSQSPPKQPSKPMFKCSTALEDKSLFKKPAELPKFRSQSRNEEDLYVRSDQLDQLHSQLNSRLSLNSNSDQRILDENQFDDHQNNNNSDDLGNSRNSLVSELFESFKLKSRKKSINELDSPQLQPKDSKNQTEDKKRSVKLPFVNRKSKNAVNQSAPQIPAPKPPINQVSSRFSNNDSSVISPGMAEYVTPVLKRTSNSNQQNDSSDESSITNGVNKNETTKKSFLFGSASEKNSKSNAQIKTRETKFSKDDEKRQSTCSITSLKNKFNKISPENQKTQKGLQTEFDQANVGKLANKFRKDKNDLDRSLTKETNQYKKVIIQLSNLIESIFDEISINDHEQLKDLLSKIDQLRKNFQLFSDFGFISLHQRFKYREILNKFESQSDELNQYYDNNVNIKLITWNKLCLNLKISLKELVAIVENQKC